LRLSGTRNDVRVNLNQQGGSGIYAVPIMHIQNDPEKSVYYDARALK
jgi:hypothetical protein